MESFSPRKVSATQLPTSAVMLLVRMRRRGALPPDATSSYWSASLMMSHSVSSEGKRFLIVELIATEATIDEKLTRLYTRGAMDRCRGLVYISSRDPVPSRLE